MKITALKKNDAKTTVKAIEAPLKKSKIAIFWENNPNGIIRVLDRRAVNK